MTRRHELQRHRLSLAEIREIMNSMKTLAFMETRKLSRFLDAQSAVVNSIEAAAADLLNFYPETLPVAGEAMPVDVLIGTERGFCGNFNHRLLEKLQQAVPTHVTSSPLLVAVGHKLCTLLVDEQHVAAGVDGAAVAEEVTTVLNEVVAELTALRESHGFLKVLCIYTAATDEVCTRQLLPPFLEPRGEPPTFSHPPVLNQSPGDLLTELADHYLLAALYEILYTSLMAENRRRVSHLDGAVRYLDDESAELDRQYNALRQEEIIEEIEAILLSASSLDQSGRRTPS